MSGDIRLYFKNEAFETMGVILQGAPGLNFTSFEWNSVFHKQDSFELNLGVADPQAIEYLLDPGTVYMIRNDTAQIARIQARSFDGQYLTLEGIGLERLLAKRFTTETDYVPNPDAPGTNYVGSVMCDIINANAPFLWLVADREKNRTGPSIATFTELTGNVYKYISMLSQAYDVGFKCVFNEDANKVDFVTYEVVPLDVELEGRTYRFSDELGNVKSLEYEYDDSKYYNYVRVIGGDYTQIVDQSGGGERYEYSFKSKTRIGDRTGAEYLELLYVEGVQELAKRKPTETFVVEAKEGQYVELGWEAQSLSRLINYATLSFCTEIKETWESTYTREYTFGYRADAEDTLIIRLQGEFNNG